MAKINIKIDSELYNKVKKFCDNENIRLVSFIENAIEEGMTIGTKIDDSTYVEKDTTKPFIELDEKQAKSIWRGMAIMAEKSYRRGVQHGYVIRDGQFSEYLPIPTQMNIHDWRFGKCITGDYGAPGTPWANRSGSGHRASVIHRFESELFGGLPLGSPKAAYNAMEEIEHFRYKLSMTEKKETTL
jgi:hypothetical protein